LFDRRGIERKIHQSERVIVIHEEDAEPDWENVGKAAEQSAARAGLNPDQAQDVRQDTLEALLLEPPGEISNPAGWANKVGFFKAVDEQRRSGRHARPTDLADKDELTLDITERSPEDIVLDQMMVDELVAMVEREATKPQKDAFYALRDSGGHMGDAIRLTAALTGRSEGTMRTHLFRVRLKLRNLLEEGTDDDE